MTPHPQQEYTITEVQLDEWLSHWIEKYQDVGKEVKIWIKENSRPHSTAASEGELEYGSILPNGEDWRLRRFDAGMGETEYRIFRNEVFFAQFDNRKDADFVMGLMRKEKNNHG